MKEEKDERMKEEKNGERKGVGGGMRERRKDEGRKQ